MKRDSSTSWLHLKSDLQSIQETIQSLESSVRKVEAELIEAEDREEGLNLRHVSRNLKVLREGESQEAILEQLLNQSLEYVERAILFLKEGESFIPLKESNLPLDLGSLKLEDPEDPVFRCARHKAVLEVESHIPEKFPWMPADTDSGRSAVCIPVLFSNSPRIVFYGDSRDSIDVHGLELLLQLGALVLQNHYLTVMNSGTWQPEKQTRWPALEEEAPEPEPEEAEPDFEEPSRETEPPVVAEAVNEEEEEGEEVSEPLLTVEEPPESEADAEPEPTDAEFTMSEDVITTELPEEEAPAPEKVTEEEEDESLRDEFLEAMRVERERSDERSRFTLDDVQFPEIEREEPPSSEEGISLEEEREEELSPEDDRIEIEDTFEPFDFSDEEDARRVIFDFDEEETREDAGEEAAAEPGETDEDFDWEQVALADSDSLLTETEEERAIEEPSVAEAVEPEEVVLDDEEEETIHADAKRFARLLVTEIKLYHEQDVEEGRESSDLYARLRRDIDRSREMYEKRADPRVKEKADYFHEEMVRILAQEDPSLMGADYPGPRLNDSGG